VLSLASAVIALRGPQRALDWAIWRPTVAGSVFGYGAGVALLAWLSTNVVTALRLLLGIVVIACAVVVLRRTQAAGAALVAPRSLPRLRLVSGVLGGLFSASGPPLVYQYYRQPAGPGHRARPRWWRRWAAGSLIRLALVVPAASSAPVRCCCAPCRCRW
jgi:hypothetical protein